jgi:hypothetical protein
VTRSVFLIFVSTMAKKSHRRGNFKNHLTSGFCPKSAILLRGEVRLLRIDDEGVNFIDSYHAYFSTSVSLGFPLMAPRLH